MCKKVNSAIKSCSSEIFHSFPEAVRKFKSPCNPPFSKGEMLKRGNTIVHRKCSRIPLCRVRVPLFGKEGAGEICGVRSGPLQFFHGFPLPKGEIVHRASTVIATVSPARA